MTHIKWFFENDTESRKKIYWFNTGTVIVICMHCHLLVPSVITAGPGRKGSLPLSRLALFPACLKEPGPCWRQKAQVLLWSVQGAWCRSDLGSESSLLSRAPYLTSVKLSFLISKMGWIIQWFVRKIKTAQSEAQGRSSVHIHYPPFSTFWKPGQRNTEF